MIETRERSAPDTAKARRWRNRWRSIEGGQCRFCNLSLGPGGHYRECCRGSFATQAEAEADAMDDVVEQIQLWGRMTDEWLGAFPDPG